MIERLDQGRVWLEMGPLRCSIYLEREGEARPDLAETVAEALQQELTALTPYMARFRKMRDFSSDETDLPATIRRMVAALECVADPTLNTLAAVAGAMSDYGLALGRALDAERILINNGGDIALFDAKHGFNVAIPGQQYGCYPDMRLEVLPADGIGGICSSGLHGRSFTRGIADFVVALAADAATADAAATHLANSSYVDDPQILSCLAEEIDSGTDIPGLRVTLKVGDLQPATRDRALLQVIERAEALIDAGVIKGVIVGIQGRAMMSPETLRLSLQQDGCNRAADH